MPLQKKYKVGVIVPTRGDRPEFLKHCRYLISQQTLTPERVMFVDFEPESDQCDITKRYRFGYNAMRNFDFDVIAFMENDDWYSPDYLETMVREWENFGRPDLFGLTYTIYYNLRVFGYFKMQHYQRSSAMSTLIKPDLSFDWCPDHEPFTDVHLFNTLRYKLWTPPKHICLGIKHGIGKTGGKSHVDRLYRYSTNGGVIDEDKAFLKSIVEPHSFDFYVNLLDFKETVV